MPASLEESSIELSGTMNNYAWIQAVKSGFGLCYMCMEQTVCTFHTFLIPKFLYNICPLQWDVYALMKLLPVLYQTI